MNTTTTAQRRLTELSVEVTLVAPWLVHGNDPGHLGLDAVQLRRSDGLRVLPGTLLAGPLRDTWSQWRSAGLQAAPDPLEWFGPSSQADDEEDAMPAADSPSARRMPRRARLHVDDLAEIAASAGQLQPATRVPISPDTGAGIDGMLQFVEQREAPGTPITFRGTWRAWLTPGESSDLVNGIGKALQWQTQVGALRSIGFGEVKSTKVSAAAAKAPVVAAEHIDRFCAANGAASRAFVLDLDRPLVIASQRIGGNLFESSDVIPGAALKATLAHGYRQRGEALPPWFDALRITHAMPSRTAARPSPIPLALVRGNDAQGQRVTWSTARHDGPVLDAQGRAAAFPIDWKDDDFGTLREKTGWGAVRRSLRVRTAIEDGKAKDQSLFAYRAVESALNGGTETATATRWTAHLDLPAPWDRDDKAWRELARVLTLSALGPIGKTDAFARVELAPDAGWVWPPEPQAPGDSAVLLLMTPALLGASETLLSVGLPDTTSGALQQAYQLALDEAAEAAVPGAAGCMALHTFKAAQQLAGGSYLHKRFMRTPRYRPWVLTEAGSVFTLKLLRPEVARQVLLAWQQHGLPLGASTAAAQGTDWQRNPWLPENGYGEVCVNPAWPFADQPATPR